MTPALLLGPLLVAHAIASVTDASLPRRHLQRGPVTVDAVARPRADGSAAGRLDVKTPGGSQRIELGARWMGPEMLVASVQLVDANFDGHPDVAVVRDFGAKWTMSDVYLFDPKTRRFGDASPLARELSRLPNVGFDAARRRVTSYDIGPSRPSRQVYEVAGAGLRLVESCAFLNDGAPLAGTLVRSRLVGGAMRTTYTQLRLGAGDLAPCGP